MSVEHFNEEDKRLEAGTGKPTPHPLSTPMVNSMGDIVDSIDHIPQYTSNDTQLTKAHPTDAGYDIYCNEDMLLTPRWNGAISTGLYMAIPIGWVGLIRPRSGSSFKAHIETGAGVIDSGYRAEVKIKLYNFGTSHYKINKGDRIAQIVVVPCYMANFLKVDKLPDADRGDKGFGSSGK